MNKCRSYFTRESFDIEQNEMKEIGFCMSTKECEPCTCGGDPSKCDFYESKRKEEKKMTTAEMWIKAQEDGKLYNASDLYYHRNLGFVDSGYAKWRNVNATDLMKIHDWKEIETKVPIMSKEEAEKKFNIKIIG